MYPRSLKERGRIEDFGNGGIMEYGDIIIIITKPKLAYDRQVLAGSWGQNTVQVGILYTAFGKICSGVPHLTIFGPLRYN